MVQQGYDLIGIMEQMIADYDELLPGTSLNGFKTNIDTNAYYTSTASYTSTTAYIKFNGSGVEEPDTSGANNLLKVTITEGSQSLTSLFTEIL